MRIDFTPSPDLFPFRSRFWETDGARVHYVDEGDGPPIVMFHGNPTWSFLYRKIITRLKPGFRCIAVDLPGFGLSDRPDGYGYTPAEHAAVVGKLVDHLELDAFGVMGQDWGGPIGLSVAAERVPRVSGLVFMNTWFWPADRLNMTLFGRALSTKFMQKKILNDNFFVEKLIPRSVSNKLSPEEMDHYRKVQPAPEARRGVAEFPRQILAAGPWLKNLSEKAPSVLSGKPVLLVWGMKDSAFGSRAFTDRWKGYFPGAELVTAPAANHYIQEDVPDLIAQAVESKFGKSAS